MRRMLCVLAVLSALAPAAGRANHCGSDIVVFSRNDVQRLAGIGAVNPNAAACQMPNVEGVDTRLLTPLATEITVRYTRDLGAQVSALIAIVNGRGFVDAEFSLSRVSDPTTGLYSYRSAALMIPSGGVGSGVIRVRIAHSAIPGGSDQVCFHTADASC